MPKENAIIDQTQETEEFEALNARVLENNEQAIEQANEEREKVMQSQAERIIRHAEEHARKEAFKAKKAKAMRKAYTVKCMVQVILWGMLAVAVTLAGMAGMIHPYISYPVAMLSVCAACLHFGVWYGRMQRK